MELDHITFRGPEIDDPDVLERCPEHLVELLKQINGFIQFGGGFHLRGASAEPAWHSLRAAWDGESALHALYDAVEAEDAPFAQDCVGDQYVLRGDLVHRLYAETGELVSLECDLVGFLEEVQDDPVAVLSLEPLLHLHQEKHELEAGDFIQVSPPFCFAEAADGVSLRIIGAAELLAFHADLAGQIRDLPDGATISFEVKEDDD